MPAGDRLVELPHPGQGPPADAVDLGVLWIDVQRLLEIDELGLVEVQRVARVGHGHQRRDVPRIDLEHLQPA